MPAFYEHNHAVVEHRINLQLLKQLNDLDSVDSISGSRSGGGRASRGPVLERNEDHPAKWLLRNTIFLCCCRSLVTTIIKIIYFTFNHLIMAIFHSLINTIFVYIPVANKINLSEMLSSVTKDEFLIYHPCHKMTMSPMLKMQCFFYPLNALDLQFAPIFCHQVWSH